MKPLSADNNQTNLVMGGTPLTIVKSDRHFAVKKQLGMTPGVLQAGVRDPNSFAKLSFSPHYSCRDLEVYEVQSDHLEQAMKVLRADHQDAHWCAHVYHLPDDANALMVPTDAVYIEWDPGAEPAMLNPLLDEYGLEIANQAADAPNQMVLRLTSASKMNPLKIAAALQKSPLIRVAEPDFAYQVAFKAYRPSDPLFEKQWHLENKGGFGLTSGADVSAPQAWDVTRGNRNIVVCVMDDGVDLEHPDFASPGKIVGPRDFGQNDNDPTPVRNGRGGMGDNHGTACAGVAVADENGAGVVGVAPGCALMPIRTSNMITSESIENLFDYARESNADVISCSWGVSTPFFTLSTRMKNAIAKTAKQGRGGKGCVILFAAGNENRPVNGSKNGHHFRAGFAIHPNVIAVAASNSRDRRSHYSNYGAEIWVCAPSSGAGGQGIVTTDRSGAPGYQQGDYTTRETFGGTSSSTPLVAGICGLILSINPDLSAGQVKDILKRSADPIDVDGGEYKDGHSPFYGYGRVNAARAVAEAVNGLPDQEPVRRIIFESHPNLAIPDHSPVGVTDVIAINDEAVIASVEVGLEIHHTYRGDLKVELTAPDGRGVVLHDRQGGGENNLVRAYKQSEFAPLRRLVGMPANGSWVLQVRDLAARDLGRLVRWSLTVGVAESRTLFREAQPGRHIPDNDASGISDVIELEASGGVEEIEITVDITHSYRGDLQVELIAPNGVMVALHQRQGGSRADLKQTFRVGDTPGLQAIVDSNVPVTGSWRLAVADLAGADVGKLNAWSIKVRS